MNPFGTLVAASLATLSVVAWAWVAARIQRGEVLVAYRPRRPVPWTGGDLCAVMLIFLLANLGAFAWLPMSDRAAAGMVAEDDGPAEPDEADQWTENAARLDRFELKLVAGATANLVTMLLAVAWLVGRRGARWSDFGLASDRAWQDIGLGIVGFVAVSLPVYALQFLLSHLSSRQHPIIETLGRQPDNWLFLLSGLSAVAVAPVAEEFFFRVLLQGWLESLGEAPQFDGDTGGGGAPALAGDQPSAAADVPAADVPAADVPAADVPAAVLSERSVVFGDAFRSPATDDVSRSRPLRTQPNHLRTQPNQPWDTAAIGVTSLVFALLHLGQGWAPVPLFFLSLALGWLYQRTHRLLPSMVVHVCLNGCSLVMLRMASG